MRVRLLGVTASNLGEREQLALFEADRAAAAPGRRGGRCHPAAVRRTERDPRAGLSARGCRRRSSATRATRSDRRARGVPTDADEVADAAAAGDSERDTLR